MQISGNPHSAYARAAADLEAFWDRPNQAILKDFVAITEHDSGRTARGVAAQATAALRREASRTGKLPALRDVLTDPELLGRVMANDQSLRTGQQLSRETMRLVRHAFRALSAGLPPPPGHTREELRGIFELARSAGERWVGARRRLAVGARTPRPRYDPTADEIAGVGEWLRRSDASGVVFAELITFLYSTGVRMGAALALRRGDLQELHDHSAWVYVYEKARRDRRPVLLRPTQHAVLALWRTLPPEAALWTTHRGPITPNTLRARIEKACRALGIERFHPHSLRAAFARDHLDFLGLDGVRRAGGWGTEAALEVNYLNRSLRDGS